ncbi:MAG: hypothetical protein K0Q73_525 [Paenibacillus sp.]|nr:hypothetical protein [Paenibacillus sp.]
MKKWLPKLLIASMLAAVIPVNAVNVSAEGALPAFPGAEGGGKYVSGGRGQVVYEVTTLEDYKSNETPIPGSLRDAVSQSDRTIVFRVGGTVRLKESLKIKGSNLTIAGQTAPGDGITVTDYTTNIEADNVIVRYMRFRLGDRYPSEDDAFGVRYHKDIMIDHSSFSWSVDEVVSLYDNANTTVQWSISAESMLMTSHHKGRHGYGGIWGGNQATYHHNLIAHSVSRNPRFPTVITQYPDITEASNNIIYNWGFMSTYGGGDGQYNLNNNYYKFGPNTYSNVRNLLFGELGSPSKMYINGNMMDGDSSVTADNWKGVLSVANPASKLSAPVAVNGGYISESAQAAYEHVLANVGATLPKRDAYDARVIHDVIHRTGQHINSPLEVGGYPDYPVVISTVVDQDHDGMDDAWEAVKGLSPANADDRNATNLSPEGYTNLEVYLNDLIVQGTSSNKNTDNPVVSITSPVNNILKEAGSQITVEASASDSDGIAKAELIIDGAKVAEDTTAPYSFDWSNVTDGTHFLVVRATDTMGLSTHSDNVAVHVNTSGPITPWQSQDIGNVGIPGHTQLGGDAQTVTVKSAGDIGGSADSFHFAYQPLTGNGEIIARIEHVTPTDDNAEAGVMVRESLNASSKMAMLSIPYVKMGEKGVMISRSSTGEESARIEPDDFIATPYWVKLVRIGSQLTGLISSDKTNWKQIGSLDIPMAETVYFGLAADASKAPDDINKYNTSEFSGVELHALAADFPMPPQAQAATAGENKAVLTWSPVSEATGYRIKRSDIPGGPYTTVMSDVSSLTFTDSNLTTGKTYYYVISAVNAHGESFDSKEVNVTPTGAPEVVWLVADDFEGDAIGEMPTGYTLINPIPMTATNKVITQTVPGTSAGNSSTKAMQLYDTGSVNTRTAKSFTPQKGTVIIEADYMQQSMIGSAGLFQLQTPDGGKTPLSLEIRKPSNESNNVFVINNGGTYIKVTNEQPSLNRWMNIKIEANVLTGKSKIYVDNVPAATPEIDFLSTALADTKAKGIGRIHFSTPGSGTGSPYWDNVKVYVEPVASPKGLAAVPGNTQIQLNWDAAQGAESYTVKRSTASGGPYQTVASGITATSYIDAGLQNETAYYYVVTGVGAFGESAPSNEVKVTPSQSAEKPEAPAGLMPGVRNSQIDLSWHSVNHAVSYMVKRSLTSDGPYTKVAETTATSYRDGGLSNGTMYYYVVSAKSVGGEGQNSVQVQVQPAAPVAAPAINVLWGNAQAELRWNAVDGSSTYIIQRASAFEGPYITLQPMVTSTNYTDTGLENGNVYYYKVTASGINETSLESAVVSGRPVEDFGIPAAPAAVKAVNSANQEISLSWSPAQGAAAYRVKRSEAEGGPYQVVAEAVAGTRYADNRLTQGKTYFYIVTAVNANGESYSSAQVKADAVPVITVAKDQSGQFSTVQAAVDSIPNNNPSRTVIRVKAGEYREKVLIGTGKTNLSLVGDGPELTKIIYNDSASKPAPGGGTIGTSGSYTLSAQANNFVAEDLTIENDAGLTAGQAVALQARGDRQQFRNVRLVGFQDTLLADGIGRQYFVDSYIDGSVDFIFGSATAVFDRTVIHSKAPGYVTAASTPQGAKGYVFVNSRLTADAGLSGKVDLGRPWRPYANVVYINNFMDDHIRPAGWNNWGNAANEATADYGEYLSYGPGANPAGRLSWTKQLTKEEAAQYTVTKVLAGNDGWNPVSEDIRLLNSNAALTGMMIDGTQLADFTKQKYDYVVTLPYGTTNVPQVSTNVNEATSTVQTVPADKLPGKAELKVTAEDGTQRIYTISFEVDPDRVPPSAIITYSTSQSTNQPVTVTMEPSEPVFVTNNNGSYSYTFMTNGSFTFEFTDEAGNKGTATAVVSNIDTAAPTLEVIPDHLSLSPANHKLVSVHMNVYGQDEGSGVSTIVLTSITSNEPDNGLGDGDTSEDIQGAAYGTSDTDFLLRAERSGKGMGRIYRITYTVTDLAGNQMMAVAEVKVPH